MKKLLSIFGSIAIISSSASSPVFSFKPNECEKESLNVKSLKEIKENKKHVSFFVKIKILGEEFQKLSSSDKEKIAKKLNYLAMLKDDKSRYQYLLLQKEQFISNNKDLILQMYNFTSELRNLNKVVLGLSLSIDWNKVKNYINIDFTNTNDYAVGVGTYGPSHWWAFWEWGLRVDIHEGLINLIKIGKLFAQDPGMFERVDKALNGIKELGKIFYEVLKPEPGSAAYIPVSDLLPKLTHISQLILDTNFPFTDKAKYFLQNISEVIKKVLKEQGVPENTTLRLIWNDISMKYHKEYGINLESVITSFLYSADDASKITSAATTVIKLLPDVIVNLVASVLYDLFTSIIKADSNRNGVYIKFSQFVIPTGFKAR